MSTRTDEQLVEQYRSGDTGAFRTLIENYQADLLRFLFRLTGDRQLSEDIFQETFLQVHISLDSFDSTRRFRPWLFTIAANKARDMLRKKSRRQALDLSAPVSESRSGDGERVSYIDLMEVDVPQPDQAMLDSERDNAVQSAVNSLPHALREILLLAYFQRLSYAEMAEELNIPLGTVKSRLHSAVAAFAKKWRDAQTQPSAKPA